MNTVKVTYVCAKTGLSVVSTNGLPKGWVVPTSDLSSDVTNSTPPPRYTVVAFSSKDVMNRYIEENKVNN